MEVSLQIEAPALSDESIHKATQELCRTFNNETEISAKIPVGQSVPGSKGEPITVGVLLLAFLTSGTAVALMEVIKAFFERNKTLGFKLTRADGEVLEIGAEHLRARQFDQTLSLAKEFVGNDP